MIKVNNHFELEEVLSSLDMMEFIQIQIGNVTMDLFYEPKIDRLSMFEDCEYTFDTLDEMSNFIQFYYMN